jgi:hypothetical protein
MVELAQNFFPPGVFQALSGDDNLGPWLTSHPGIDKISFTGSTATGKKVMESASKNLTRITLELYCQSNPQKKIRERANNRCKLLGAEMTLPLSVLTQTLTQSLSQ